MQYVSTQKRPSCPFLFTISQTFLIAASSIEYDPHNALFYTNRAMASLKLSPPNYRQVAADSYVSLDLLPKNLKAYFFLAQAQIELGMCAKALESAKAAHRLCVEECMMVPMGKGSSNIEKITALVLRCKKEWWEEQENERLHRRSGLLTELVGLLERSENESEKEEKIGELRSVFEMARIGGEDARHRKVPDWAIDDITFSVMLDPVIVCSCFHFLLIACSLSFWVSSESTHLANCLQTKNGQSYDRSSIMEHLKRSQTDPLTREPLKLEDLRPNRALKEACADFLAENGWAVDW